MKTLKNIFAILLFLLIGNISAQTSYIFNDEFDSKGDWPSGNSDKRELKIYNGRYYFNHKREKGSWSIATENLDIDFSRNFEIETSIQKISGVSDYGFGLMYNRTDNDNMSQFSITSSGYFRVGETKDGSYTNLKEWTKSSNVKSGNYATNIFKIKKEGNTLTFYLNKKSVYSTTFKNFTGKRAGIVIYRNQKISIDYIKVKYLSVSSNVTNNTTKKYKSKTVMYDSFYSNRNSWAVGENEKYKLEIRNSKYYFTHKRETKGFTTTLTKYIDTNRDFKIEAKIEKISGIQGNGYGIVYGRLDAENQNQFTVNGNGSYSIDRYEGGKFIAVKDWTKSSSIKKGNYATNILKVSKEGNRMKFYINGDYVYSKNFEHFFGDRVGFALYQNQKVAIDYLRISYLDSKPNINNNFNNNNNTAKGDVVVNEQFNNNSNNWLENDNDDTRYKVKYGKYYFKHKKNTSGYSTYISKYFDSSKEFEIETKIEKISGVTNYGYGLLWGKKDKNSFRFYITGNGYYKIVRNVNGEEEQIIKWTKTSEIKTGNGSSNTLKIKKQGNAYKFYINNRYVNQIDYEPLYGDKMGYVVFNDQEIAVDYLTVKYLKKTSTTVVTNKSLSVPLFDTFSSNTNGWVMEDSENYSASMVNGKLLIDRKKKGGIFVSRSIDLNTSKDFILETSIAKVLETGNGLYGFTFGRKNSSNEYSFLLSSKGEYMLRKFDNDKYHKLIPFTTTSAMKGVGQSNKIKIIKSSGILRIYINDQYVNEVPFEGFFGDKFGYTVFHSQKISVDYLTIKYQTNSSYNSPPTIVVTEPNVEAKRGFKIVKIVEGKRILVRGKATDPDGIYEITINGIEASVFENGTFSANVPLKYGKNDLVIKATDIKQATSTKTFTVKRKSSDTNNTVVTTNTTNKSALDIGFGKYYALIIGVSEYEDEDVPDLNGEPTKDAKALSTVLINQYSFQKQNVKVLLNPTENDILKEFYRLSEKVTNKDNLLIFYAGHGNYNKKSETGYWMPSDVQMKFDGNTVENSVIVTKIKAIQSKHTLLISDACFSGSIFSTRSFKSAPKSIQKKYNLPSRKAITSGTLKTVPNKSVFMKYLLNRLKTNTDKYMSASKLFSKIEEPVMNNADNEPQYHTISGTGDEGGDFIFIKKN